MKQVAVRTGNPAEVSSPIDISIPPPHIDRFGAPLRAVSPAKSRSASPAHGLRRGARMATKGSSPPTMRSASPFIERKGSPPSRSGERARSPVTGRDERASQNRRNAGSPARRSVSVVAGVGKQQRSRADTRTTASRPQYAEILSAAVRPKVPPKNTVTDHARSKSLSPTPGEPSPRSFKTATPFPRNEQKNEKRKNAVFGLFPSEPRKATASSSVEKKDSEGKRGMAEHIATIFSRKPHGDSSSTNHSRAQTPHLPNSAASSTLSLSPPELWLDRAAPLKKIQAHSQSNSQSPQPSHQNGGNQKSTHKRNQSSLAWQVEREEEELDIDEAVKKVWGPIERAGFDKLPKAPLDSPATLLDRQYQNRGVQRKRLTIEPSPLLPPVNRGMYRMRTKPLAPILSPPRTVHPPPSPIPAQPVRARRRLFPRCEKGPTGSRHAR